MLKINLRVGATATTFGSIASLLGVVPVNAAAPCIVAGDVDAKIAEAVILDDNVIESSALVDSAVVRLRAAKSKEAAARNALQELTSGAATGSVKSAKAAYTKARTARIAAQTRLTNVRKQLEAINLAVRANVEREFLSYVCVDSRLLGLAASSGNGTVTVSWRNIEAATRYILKRDGITLANTTGTTFVDTRANNGIEHEYQVFALSQSAPEDADSQVSPVEFSNHTLLTSDTVVGAGTLPSPTSLTASSTSTSVALMWSAVPNATGYQILRNGEVIASTMATNYIDQGLASSSVFGYSVRAMQGGVLSVATPEKIASTLATTLLAPTNLTAVAGNGLVSLSWSVSANASGYRVYRDNTLLASVNAVAFVDASAALGVTYQYSVSAINSTSESLKSAAVSGAAAVTAPAGLVATPGNLNVSLAWSAVDGADSYRVFRNGTLIANVDSPEYSDSNVSNGTVYTYTVRTVVGTVASSPSAAAVAMPDSIILSAPSNIVATAGDRSVSLRWDAVTGAGNYQVLRNGTVIALPLTNSYVDSGLTNGVTYTYTLKAVSGSHSSLVSTAVTAVPAANAVGSLAAPTNVSALAGDASVNLAWSAVAGATSYEVRRGGVLISTVALTTYADSGLTNGVTYSYTVTAVNATATSPASTAVTATPTITAPAVPTGLVASPGDARVSLTWNAVTGATSYSVLRNGSVIGTTSVASYVDLTALNGTMYSYSIKAINAGGTSAASTAVSATPIAAVIPVPTGLVATPGDAQIALTWTVTPGAVSYQVLRGGVLIASPTTNSYIDTGVSNGTTYSYTLKAVTASGTSAASSSVSATPVAAITQLAAPTGLVANTATALNTGAFRLQWTAVAGATGYSVYRDGVLLGTSATNSYTPSGVTYGSINSYYVVATDAVVSHTSLPSATISVGVYRGVAANDARGREVYGQIQVYAILTGTTITGCWATYPTSSDSGSINRNAIPNLCSQTLTKQPTSATVATLITNISGATATVPAFKTSLQDALTQAGK